MDAVYQFLHFVTTGKQGFILEIAICEATFVLFSKPRRWSFLPAPWLLIPAAVIAHFLFGYHVPMIPMGLFTVTIHVMMIFIMTILLQWAVFDLPIHRVIFNSVAAYAVQHLTLNARQAIISMTGFQGWPALLLKFGLTVLFYAACFYCFARKAHRTEFNINYISLYLVSFLTVFITDGLFNMFVVSDQTGIVVNLTMTICCLLALMVQFSAFQYGNLNKEAEILEQLLYREQKQHELTQETIEIINIKSHDLKKQISILKGLLGDNARELIGEVENAVIIYDDLVNTGNKNLDLIISEEKLFCEKYGIELDVMADGGLIDFMAPFDVYSLIGNALTNAIESTMHEKEGCRTITLDIHASGNYICIEITNYCTQSVKFVNGVPVTSKEDKKFHGYGVRSMEYVVKKYGGNMVMNYRDNIFTVKIIVEKPPR